MTIFQVSQPHIFAQDILERGEDVGLRPPTTQELACGNKICTADESCTSCPGDCGRCADLNVDTVRQSANRLRELLANPANSTFKKRLSTEDQEQIEELTSATKLDFWTRGRIARMLRSLERAIAEEAQALSATVSTLLQSGTLEERWPLLDKGKIEEALQGEDVQSLLFLFPPSTQNLRVLSQELEKFSDALTEESSPSSSPSGSLFGTAFAAEEASGIDPKERFQKAVSLLQRVEREGRDPRVIFPLLEQKLSSLMTQSERIGAAAKLPVEEVARKLERVEQEAETASFEELLSLLGEMRSLEQEEERPLLDASLAQATGEMRSGISLHATILSEKSPKLQAQALLRSEKGQDIVDILAGNDVGVQKDALAFLLEEQEEDIRSLLAMVTEERGSLYSQRLDAVQEKLMVSKTSLDIRMVLDEWNDLVREIQSAARAERGPILRFIYFLQDFLGRT